MIKIENKKRGKGRESKIESKKNKEKKTGRKKEIEKIKIKYEGKGGNI